MNSLKPFPVISFTALLIGGTAIGFAGILMRLSDVSPIASAFWRVALASPLLWGWAFAVRDDDCAAGRPIDFAWALALAGIFFAGDMVLWHWSLRETTVANATLLSNLAPIVIAVWMWWAYKTRFTRVFIIGMCVALIGAVLLVEPNATVVKGSHKLLGDALGLASAIFYAGYQLAVKGARSTYSTARLMAWSSTITALVLLPLALASSERFFPAHIAGWLPLIGLALIAQIGGQTVIAYAMAQLPASLASVGLLVQPLTATIAAWILFSEKMGSLQIAGGALLLTGIYLSKKGH